MRLNTQACLVNGEYVGVPLTQLQKKQNHQKSM
jgi:hypothetical protein